MSKVVKVDLPSQQGCLPFPLDEYDEGESVECGYDKCALPRSVVRQEGEERARVQPMQNRRTPRRYLD